MKYLLTLLLFSFAMLPAQTVYKTPSGAKYHLASCRMVKNVSSKLTIEKAQSTGLSPCSICKPPFSTRLGISSAPVKKTHGVNSPNQCKAKTKAGIRCKRNTRIGNDFCFQHIR